VFRVEAHVYFAGSDKRLAIILSQASKFCIRLQHDEESATVNLDASLDRGCFSFRYFDDPGAGGWSPVCSSTDYSFRESRLLSERALTTRLRIATSSIGAS
jgi:hypothetical protein